MQFEQRVQLEVASEKCFDDEEEAEDQGGRCHVVGVEDGVSDFEERLL